MVSSFWLYLGVFLCCTGVGLVPGAILIFIWGITQITSREVSNTTTNNYNFESKKFTDIYDRNTSTDGDTVQDYSNKRKYNHKKDDFSNDTREEMK